MNPRADGGPALLLGALRAALWSQMALASVDRVL